MNEKGCIVLPKKKDTYFIVLLGISLLLIYLFKIDSLNTICVIGDEFGYWASGAYFAGLDWGDVACFNPYYSYGYGLWLSLIIKFFDDSILAYKVAIILNCFFIVS